MATGLRELAEELGLSMTTVSRALNGFPEVGAATRERVRRAAERTGYRANATARRLATGRANAFGIVFSTERDVLDSPIVTDFLSGVGEVCAAEGIDLLLSPTRPGGEVATCRRLIASGTVDALIVFANLFQDEGMMPLAGSGFPIVVHGRPPEGCAAPSLSIDNRGAFRLGAAHLLALGHRRIALLNGDERQTYAIDRRRGFLDALEAAGVPVRSRDLTSGAHSFRHGLETARRILRDPDRPTALLCSSILTALGAMKAAAERGLAVPADLSLLAHDDGVASLPPEMASSALSTLHSPVRAAGLSVARLALRRIAGDAAGPLTEVWPAELVERESTAAPPDLLPNANCP